MPAIYTRGIYLEAHETARSTPSPTTAEVLLPRRCMQLRKTPETDSLQIDMQATCTRRSNVAVVLVSAHSDTPTNDTQIFCGTTSDRSHNHQGWTEKK
eukprot:5873595-Amphidinium_carterae.2